MVKIKEFWHRIYDRKYDPQAWFLYFADIVYNLRPCIISAWCKIVRKKLEALIG
jgi:hypothetical protein